MDKVELAEFQEVYTRLIALRKKHLDSFAKETSQKKSARGVWTVVFNAFKKLPYKQPVDDTAIQVLED